MKRLLSGLTLSLIALVSAPAQAASSQDACAALMEARGHLVNMLSTTDKAALDELKNKVKFASVKVDDTLAAMEKGYNAVDAQKVAEFRPVWNEFKNTRDSNIIPAIYAGKIDEAKGLATGVQAERMKKMKATMGCQ